MLGARGPWRKMREIGKGAFGLVYLVQRGNDERKFVMKEVNLRGLPREAMMEAQNEVAVLKKLKVRSSPRTAPPPCVRTLMMRVRLIIFCSIRTPSPSRRLSSSRRRCAS